MNQPALETLRPNQFLIVVTWWTTIYLCGCQPAEQLPVEVQKQLVSKSSESVGQSANEESSGEEDKPAEKVAEPCEISDVEWIRRDQLPWSYSEVQYVGSVRTGYSNVTVDRSGLSELKQLRIRREDVIDRTTDGAAAPQRKIVLEIFEKHNGEMSSFRFDSKIEGVSDLVVEGRVVFNDLEITKREGKDPPMRLTIPWVRQNWGPFGIQASLMRQPMKPGELRSAQVFIPQLARFVPVLFEAQAMVLTPLAQGKSQELLQIDLTIGTAESGMLTSLFVDSSGVIQKTLNRSGQAILSMQVPVDTVQRIADQSEFSRGIARRLTVSGELGSLLKAVSARFIIEAEDQDPYDIILRNIRQQLRSINPDRCELTISEPGKPDIQSSIPSGPQLPDASMLESSPLIPVEKELTATLLTELLPNHSSSSPAERAEAIRAAVHGEWQLKPIGSEIVSTLVSARDRSGSCIEAAHLLATLLRHEKIPTSLVSGLKIDPATGETRFHVWNQAWLNDRWVELDSTIPGQIGNLHISMSASTGAGQNPYAHYLTVLNAIAKIRSLRLVDTVEPQ